jgi:hypothetical protein
VLLTHLLKWQHQPDKCSPSWRTTIRNQRGDIADLLDRSPGLKSKRRAELVKAYGRARDDAADKTGLPPDTFPTECPWTLEQVEDAAFRPEWGSEDLPNR